MSSTKTTKTTKTDKTDKTTKTDKTDKTTKPTSWANAVSIRCQECALIIQSILDKRSEKLAKVYANEKGKYTSQEKKVKVSEVYQKYGHKMKKVMAEKEEQGHVCHEDEEDEEDEEEDEEDEEEVCECEKCGEGFSMEDINEMLISPHPNFIPTLWICEMCNEEEGGVCNGDNRSECQVCSEMREEDEEEEDEEEEVIESEDDEYVSEDDEDYVPSEEEDEEEDEECECDCDEECNCYASEADASEADASEADASEKDKHFGCEGCNYEWRDGFKAGWVKAMNYIYNKTTKAIPKTYVCSNCNVMGEITKKCAGTCGGVVRYCSKYCQTEHWSGTHGHKKVCNKN